MPQVLRPYATAGVALVGAGLIASVFAVTPATAPSPGVPHVDIPAIQLASNDPNAAIESLLSTLDSDLTHGFSTLESSLTTDLSGLGLSNLDSDLAQGFSTLESDVASGFATLDQELLYGSDLLNSLGAINNSLDYISSALSQADYYLSEIVSNTAPLF